MIIQCDCWKKKLTEKDNIEVAKIIRGLNKKYKVTIKKSNLIDVRF